MQMTFEEFEVAPARTLSAAQERRLNRLHLTGDISGGPWSTVESLLNLDYLTMVVGGKIRMTEKGAHYCHHHGCEMPV